MFARKFCRSEDILKASYGGLSGAIVPAQKARVKFLLRKAFFGILFLFFQASALIHPCAQIRAAYLIPACA
jgi:hypothetical protein